jgi:hypothetical protein
VYAAGGGNDIGKRSLHDDQKTPAISGAAKLSLESFAAGTDTPGQVSGGLSLDNYTIGKARKGKVSSLQSFPFKVPAFGKIWFPRVRIWFPIVEGNNHFETSFGARETRQTRCFSALRKTPFFLYG